ncbi:MAG: beta-ketoacyl synthase chain length factor [Bacteroidota bacterium]
MKAYITGIGAITAQKTAVKPFFAETPIAQEGEWLRSIEPDYKEYVNPVLIRRMSRVIKMGVASALMSLKEAGITMPDAIITGTGLGCIEDTENFLNNIITNKEQFLPPTPFIQSTHNTIAAQVALILKCNNYNFAYVHGGLSFESALLDAMMMMNEGNGTNILVGGTDELTQASWSIMHRMGMYRSSCSNHLNILSNKGRGSIGGEGSVFLTLSTENNNAYASINSIDIFSGKADSKRVTEYIKSGLDTAEMKADDIDLCIFGMNGDRQGDRIYDELSNGMFAGKTVVAYKHLTGEYHTANAFAPALAASILRSQSVPDSVAVHGNKPGNIRNILIYNHYFNTHHSVITLSGC